MAPAASSRSRSGAEELGRGVVDLGLQDQDGLPRPLPRLRLDGVAHDDTKHVGPARDLAGARPVADGLGPQQGQRPVSRSEPGHEQRARGGEELALARAVDRHALDEPGRGRGRHRESAVGHGDRPRPDVERRGHETVGAQPAEADHRAHDVHDRVHGADLVEVDVLRRHAVHRRFHLRQTPKERGRPLLDRVLESALLHEGDDLADAPMLVPVVTVAMTICSITTSTLVACRPERWTRLDSRVNPSSFSLASSRRRSSRGRPRSTSAPSSMSPEAPDAQSK